jgi:hypothetical protein
VQLFYEVELPRRLRANVALHAYLGSSLTSNLESKLNGWQGWLFVSLCFRPTTLGEHREYFVDDFFHGLELVFLPFQPMQVRDSSSSAVADSSG